MSRKNRHNKEINNNKDSLEFKHFILFMLTLINLWILISASLIKPNLKIEKESAIAKDERLALPKIATISPKKNILKGMYLYTYGILGLKVTNWSLKLGYIKEVNLIRKSASSVYISDAKVLHIDKKNIYPFSSDTIYVFYYISIPVDSATRSVMKDSKLNFEFKDNYDRKIEYSGLNLLYDFKINN